MLLDSTKYSKSHLLRFSDIEHRGGVLLVNFVTVSRNTTSCRKPNHCSKKSGDHLSIIVRQLELPLVHN